LQKIGKDFAKNAFKLFQLAFLFCIKMIFIQREDLRDFCRAFLKWLSARKLQFFMLIMEEKLKILQRCETFLIFAVQLHF